MLVGTQIKLCWWSINWCVWFLSAALMLSRGPITGDCKMFVDEDMWNCIKHEVRPLIWCMASWNTSIDSHLSFLICNNHKDQLWMADHPLILTTNNIIIRFSFPPAGQENRKKMSRSEWVNEMLVIHLMLWLELCAIVFTS